jgi:hypothetical protein
MTCPCNCGREVSPGRKYAGRGCYARHRPEVMTQRGRKGGQGLRWNQWNRRSPEYQAGYDAGAKSGFRRGYQKAMAARAVAA